jgi:hypothetical protein
MIKFIFFNQYEKTDLVIPNSPYLKKKGFHLLVRTNLKVPKREIFHRSDFPDFYTIKSLRVGDFGVKIKFFYKKYLGVHLGVQSSLRVCSVYL